MIIRSSHCCESKKLLNCTEHIPLTIEECSFVSLHHLQVYKLSQSKLSRYAFALEATNTMGNCIIKG